MPVMIHGRKYIPVNERVKEFHQNNKNGSIRTEIAKIEDGMCIFRASVWPDVDKMESIFIGHAYEKEDSSQINRTSYIENGETSAIGRALAAAGYGVDESYASANEVESAIHQQGKTVDSSKGIVKAGKEETAQASKISAMFDKLAKDSPLSKEQLRECKLAYCAECCGLDSLISSKMLDSKQIITIANIMTKQPATVTNFVSRWLDKVEK